MTKSKFIGWTVTLAVITFLVAGIGYPFTVRVAERVDAWAANVIEDNPCSGKPITYTLTTRRTEINPGGICEVRAVVEDSGSLQLFSPGGHLIPFTGKDANGREVEVTSVRKDQFLGMKRGQSIAFAAALKTAEVSITLCPVGSPIPATKEVRLWKSCRGS